MFLYYLKINWNKCFLFFFQNKIINGFVLNVLNYRRVKDNFVFVSLVVLKKYKYYFNISNYLLKIIINTKYQSENVGSNLLIKVR